MITNAQKKAAAKYRVKMKRIHIDLSPAEEDIRKHLENISEPSATYIKRLIREDMAKIK